RQGDRRSLSSSQEVLIRTLMTDKMPDQLKLGFGPRSAPRPLAELRALGRAKRCFAISAQAPQAGEGRQSRSPDAIREK
ncbi:hypothetical protein EQ831_18000, partial [Pseudomonas sp. ALS1279]